MRVDGSSNHDIIEILELIMKMGPYEFGKEQVGHL